MSAAWQTDIQAAQDWADQQIGTVGEARSWPPGWRTKAYEVVANSAPTGMATWWTSPEEFFEELTSAWSSEGQGMDPPTGWDELGRVWASAGQASYTAAEEERLGSASTIVVDTVSASTADVAQAGESGLAFFSPTKGWLDPTGYKFWVPVAGAGVLWFLLRR